jgi:protein phosphatase 1L
MEDFYDIKSSKIDDKQISLFGIFDGQRFVLLDFLLSLSASIWNISILSGHGGSRAAEYLKEHLFDNLMKHPEFMKDTKLAISMYCT